MANHRENKMIQRKKFDSINVVPFIDIMLVLLVIVLTTATFIQTGHIKVELPQSSSSLQESDKKELKITIQQNGEIYFGDTKIDRDDLEKKLLYYDKQTQVYLSCDKNAKFDDFVFLLDILKKNNYQNLGVVTKHE